ncbi:MAG: hypothetical protein MH208_15695 [Marinobacter sp.]|nr:hypothetical protein [Marinobacter sp.]
MDLVNWCRNAGDERAWALVSNAIAPFGSCHEGGTVELSEQAVAILRNAPEPLDVLKIYIEAVSPMSCSDSRVDIMARAHCGFSFFRYFALKVTWKALSNDRAPTPPKN